MSLEEEMRRLREGEAASRQAAADAAASRAEQSRAAAASLLPQVQELIREVLAIPDAKSVTYKVSGNWQSHSFLKRRAKRVDDPAKLGTHVGDELFGGPGVGWQTTSTYTGVWPVLVWIARWVPYANGGDRDAPVVGSMWFNRAGAVVAGDEVHGGTTPSIEFYCSTGAPAGARKSASPCPSANIFGPVKVNQLGVEQLERIFSRAVGTPTLLRAALPRILLGQKPETVVEGR